MSTIIAMSSKRMLGQARPHSTGSPLSRSKLPTTHARIRFCTRPPTPASPPCATGLRTARSVQLAASLEADAPAGMAAPFDLQSSVESKLAAGLLPLRLTIIDESPTPKLSRQALMQAEASGLPPPAVDREVHLRVEVVSAEFEGMTRIKRHMRVNQLLKEEFELGLHALSLETRAPSEVAGQ